MKVAVVVVGRVRGPLAEAVAEYEARAARYWKLEVVEVAEGLRGGRNARPEEVRRAEGERLLAAVPTGLELVALDVGGPGLSSEELAARLQEHALRASPGLAFVVGGAHGLSEEVLAAAARRLGLGPMTLPHEMARLVLAEQIYRAGTIVRGEPYHKG